MNTLSKKLLAEAFEALANNDMAKATRLFKRNWALEAKNEFHKLEEADESMEVTSMDDDFNEEIADTEENADDENVKQAILSIGELQEKAGADDELVNKLESLKGMLESLEVAEDGEVDMDEIANAVEDVKVDFEASGIDENEVNDLFKQIDLVVNGSAEDEENVEVDVADEETDAPAETEEVEEAADEELDVELEADDDATQEDVEISDSDVEDAPAEEGEEKSEEDEDDLIFDLESKADELQQTIDKLKDVQEDEKSEMDESWEKAKLPRNKLQNEEEGVKTKGMKFPKRVNIDGKVSMKIGKGEATEKASVCKPKEEKVVNDGKWTKVAKPANTAKSAKSVLNK